MPTTRTDPSSHRWSLVGLLLAALLLGGCSDEIPEPDQGPGSRNGNRELRLPEARDVVPALARTLRRRADAVLRQDRAAFLAGIARRQPGFVAEQTWYVDNLAQLPLEAFSYDVEPASLVREGRGYWAEVDLTLQLRGYDAAPVVSRDRYLFTPGRGARYLLASVTDPAWEEEQRDLDVQPWDTGPITVREGAGVLGIFDAGSESRASGLVDEVERAADAVSAEEPYGWDRSVVVYALSSPAFLAGLDDVPGDDPLSLDAVTFQVPAAGDGVADTRVVLNPRILGAPVRGRSRLLRHELTHVAIGARADGVPTWLSEGLAEYVSVRSLPPQDRAISGAALAAAEDGLTEMPPDSEFGGDTAEASYGVAWWACEYLARATDEAVLWDLLDALQGADDADAVLRDTLRLSSAELARRAGRLMLDTYRPEPDEEEKPEKKESEEPDDSASASP